MGVRRRLRGPRPGRPAPARHALQHHPRGKRGAGRRKHPEGVRVLRRPHALLPELRAGPQRALPPSQGAHGPGLHDGGRRQVPADDRVARRQVHRLPARHGRRHARRRPAVGAGRTGLPSRAGAAQARGQGAPDAGRARHHRGVHEPARAGLRGRRRGPQEVHRGEPPLRPPSGGVPHDAHGVRPGGVRDQGRKGARRALPAPCARTSARSFRTAPTPPTPARTASCRSRSARSSRRRPASRPRTETRRPPTST